MGPRRVDPYHLLFQGGQFYLLGYSHERKAIRVFRLSRIRGKVSYATKAEHDFRRPSDFDPRAYANRADWQLGEERGVAEILISERIAWQVERHFGRYGKICEAEDGNRIFLTGYSSARGIVSWVLGLGAHAHLQGPEVAHTGARAQTRPAGGAPRRDPPGADTKTAHVTGGPPGGPPAPAAGPRRADALAASSSTRVRAPGVGGLPIRPVRRRSDPSASRVW